MAVRLKPLREQTIVITGASSGIGLATARQAAAQGANVVLNARNGEALDEIVQEIQRSGGQAIAVPADVGTRDEVQRIADAAIEKFGGFDTWVNNAGVSIWSRLSMTSDADQRKLFDTNFWGVVYGSLIAAHHLQPKGGAIINVGSVVSDLAVPVQGMYSASKHAVKGFTDALRLELEADGAPISVTLIKPTSINTPFPQHAKNYTAREPKLPPPVYNPEEVAHAILHAAVSPQRDVYVGGAAKMMSTLNAVAPGLADWMRKVYFLPQQFRNEPARNRQGTLHAAGDGGLVHGDHPGHVRQTSAYTRAALHPVMTGALMAAAGVAAATLLSPSRRRHRRW